VFPVTPQVHYFAISKQFPNICTALRDVCGCCLG